MKKVTTKKVLRDKARCFHERSGTAQSTKESSRKSSRRNKNKKRKKANLARKKWVKREISKGLNATLSKKKTVSLVLPEMMNFSDRYDETVQYLSAIRMLASGKGAQKSPYKLARVSFDKLQKISTSAALVLTAELSKWDDAIRQRLTPNTATWNPKIVSQFLELGFFDLFQNTSLNSSGADNNTGKLRLVKYIKGRCGDSAKTRLLGEGVRSIVGEKVDKWAILRGGLDEAITNVSHHAYPKSCQIKEADKNWYLTGSYNEQTKELKVVFYDQGIGIPNTLPTSDVWEKIWEKIAYWSIPYAEQKKHSVLLRAAVEIDRTSTLQTDRGKGLQDLLEFIKQRRNGYLSIISLRGLYKFSMKNGAVRTKSESFKRGLNGTLIIWSVQL